jgi:hypothetical protein
VDWETGLALCSAVNPIEAFELLRGPGKLARSFNPNLPQAFLTFDLPPFGDRRPLTLTCLVLPNPFGESAMPMGGG